MPKIPITCPECGKECTTDTDKERVRFDGRCTNCIAEERIQAERDWK